MPGFITSDRYCTLSTGNLTSPSHFYKRARPRAAAPAPSPGTKHLFPAPLAGVGDAAVEAIVDDPVMAVAVSEPDVDAIIEEPIEVEDCDVPVLLEDPPAPALVELSPGHAAAVGNFTFAVSHTCCATSIVFCWSAAGHFCFTQQEMPVIQSLSEHIHCTLMPHLAGRVAAQGFAQSGRLFSPNP